MRELGFTQNDFIVRVSDREAWIRFAAEHGVQEQDIPAFLGIVDKFERDRPEECQRKLDSFHISRGDLVAFIENPPAGASERYDILLKDLEARGLGRLRQAGPLRGARPGLLHRLVFEIL